MQAAYTVICHAAAPSVHVIQTRDRRPDWFHWRWSCDKTTDQL